ncbi:hypothetical protein BJ742DRAFT_855591 [Cladochytrium replicatum]|nr:hypothetical protein BJ742DRAFT_855591 [Cladochytrium replicatum]
MPLLARNSHPAWSECPARTLDNLWTALSSLHPVDVSHPLCLLDLGCGRGGVLLHALRKNRHFKLLKAVGVDIDESIVSASSEKLSQFQNLMNELAALSNDAAATPHKVELYVGDMFNDAAPLALTNNEESAEDETVKVTAKDLIKEADVITLYHAPETLAKCADTLEKVLFPYQNGTTHEPQTGNKTLVSIGSPLEGRTVRWDDYVVIRSEDFAKFEFPAAFLIILLRLAAVTLYGVPSPKLIDISEIPISTPGHFGELDDFTGFAYPDTARTLEKKWADAIRIHEGVHAQGLHKLEGDVFIYSGQGHTLMYDMKKCQELRKQLKFRRHFDRHFVDGIWEDVLEFLTEHFKTL